MKQLKYILASALLSVAFLVVIAFATYKMLNRFYSDIDNAIFYTYCAATTKDMPTLEKSKAMFENSQRLRDAQVQLAILSGKDEFNYVGIEQLYVFLGRKIVKGANVDNLEIAWLADLIKPRLEKIEIGKRLVLMALASKRFDLARNIVTVFRLDETWLNISMAINGKTIDVNKSRQKGARYEYTLLNESISKPDKKALIEKIQKRFNVLHKGTYYVNKIILAQCALNCGDEKLAYSILNNMYFVASNPPFNFPSHRTNVRRMVAAFMAFNKKTDDLIEIIKGAPNSKESMGIMSYATPFFTFTMGVESSINVIETITMTTSRFNSAFSPTNCFLLKKYKNN